MTPDSQDSRMVRGRLGEDAAAALYERAGYSVTARNHRESHNEIDLIAENRHSIVFIEVKTRTQSPGAISRYGRPARAVDAGKRQRTVLAAEAYLRAHPTDKQPRIDVVEVYLEKRTDGSIAVLEVVPYRNAFGAGTT